MSSRPPELTAASRFFVNLLDATDNWSPRRAWTMSLLVFAGVFAAETLTPVSVNTMLLYMAATAFAVWALGETGGLSLGLLGACIGTSIKHYEVMQAGLHFIGMGAQIWNTATRFVSASVLALMVNGLRSALALERWRAASDGLTGVLNKMAFEERMGHAIGQAKAQGHALVLAYMDLDGFKGVNDRHGHSAGDRVLRTFAAAASHNIRSTDLFARIGGDEFVALMSVRSCEEGDAVAAMLHDRLTAILQETGFDVTCSMGALVSDAAAMEVDGGVLEMADMLMYEVKRSGKNALRLARGARLGATLRSAYPAPEGHDLQQLLDRIDRADNAYRVAAERRAAA